MRTLSPFSGFHWIYTTLSTPFLSLSLSLQFYSNKHSTRTIHRNLQMGSLPQHTPACSHSASYSLLIQSAQSCMDCSRSLQASNRFRLSTIFLSASSRFFISADTFLFRLHFWYSLYPRSLPRSPPPAVAAACSASSDCPPDVA